MFIFVCAAPLKARCSAEEKYSQRRWGWRGTGSTWSLSGSLSPWFWFCRQKNISRWGYCSVWQRTWGCSQICLMWTSGDRCHRPADLRGLSGPADRDPDWGGLKSCRITPWKPAQLQSQTQSVSAGGRGAALSRCQSVRYNQYVSIGNQYSCRNTCVRLMMTQMKLCVVTTLVCILRINSTSVQRFVLFL